MLVVGNDTFGRNLAEMLNVQFVSFETRVFPDGEVCPRLNEDIRDEHIVFVNRMKHPINPNRYLIESLLIIKHLKLKNNDTNIDVVMPYFTYARQDKCFRDGEAFSCKHILDMLKDAGASRFFTVTSHVQRGETEITISSLKSYNVDGFEPLGKYLLNMDLKNIIVMGADLTTEKGADKIGKVLGARVFAADKKRNLNDGTLNELRIAHGPDIAGCDVIIVDDMISTGGTLMRMVDFAKKCNANKVICAAVHPVLAGEAMKKIETLDDFIATDTIDSPASKVSVIETLAEKFKGFI